MFADCALITLYTFLIAVAETGPKLGLGESRAKRLLPFAMKKQEVEIAAASKRA